MGTMVIQEVQTVDMDQAMVRMEVMDQTIQAVEVVVGETQLLLGQQQVLDTIISGIMIDMAILILLEQRLVILLKMLPSLQPFLRMVE